MACQSAVQDSILRHAPQVPDKQGVMQDYATGHILEFTDDGFSKWIQMFEPQTQTDYCTLKESY